MFELLRALFSTDEFMPHGHCYLWQPGVVWLHVVSDTTIGLSYLAISSTLAYLVHRIRDIPFQRIYLAFGLFIVTCGFTHFLDVYTLWTPIYWFDGALRALTAVASIGTAIALPPLIPRAVALARAAELAHDRGIQLERANKELEGLYERSKELDRLKTQFFANVSHELRTPLTLILGPVEKVLESSGLTEGQRRDLDLVRRNAQLLLKHVNDLLDVARLEAGKMTATFAEVDLPELVRVTAAHFDALAQERQIDYRVETPEAGLVQVDPDKVERIVTNLLSNAFKFTPRRGTIRTTLEIEPLGHATLAVSDSGAGVPSEMRDTIFERFRQTDEGTARRFGGTGLGLAIAKELVELHGGRIEVADAAEGGASFRLVLPVTAPAGVAVRPLSAPAEGAAQLAVVELRTVADDEDIPHAGPAPLVLVVEDNPEMNRFVRQSLSLEYRVVSASDGASGLDKALSTCPDLIVSDVMMPGMSGDELVRQVRANPELDRIPILMLTAKADDELRVKLLQSGAQDYLTKPFGKQELLARARNLVTVKRTRDVLQRELASRVDDLEKLANDVTLRQRELAVALDTMRVLRDEADRASQLKGRFVSLVSHELRGPVTALQLQLRLLEREAGGKLAPRAQSIVTRITTSSSRLAQLVESLLEHARLQAGTLHLKLETVDLTALVEDVVEELRPQATEKHLEIRVTHEPGAFHLSTDASLVRICIANLVSNAVKFTDLGVVEIAVARTNDEYAVRVTDTGPGIAPEDQVRIFEPFEHLEPIRHKHTPGVGIGLALVKDMVLALRGSIVLESQVGVGSTFVLGLPTDSGFSQ